MWNTLVDFWNQLFGGSSGTVLPKPYSDYPAETHKQHTHLPYEIELGSRENTLPGEINGWDNSMEPSYLVSKPTPIVTEDPYKVDAAKTKRLDKAMIIKGVIAVEAGYVDHPSDKGGPTNFGITQSVAEENKKLLTTKFAWNGKMRDLTYDMAYAIYEVNYWDRLKLDDVCKQSAPLADKMFDIAVNCGTSRAGAWLQEGLKILNRRGKDYADINVDGGIGNASITALTAFFAKNGYKQGSKQLLRILITSQGNHYKVITLNREANEDFIHGWLNRLDHHIDYYEDMLK